MEAAVHTIRATPLQQQSKSKQSIPSQRFDDVPCFFPHLTTFHHVEHV